MEHYDFIIAGGGLSGLTLACHLLSSPLGERSILVIDKGVVDGNARTWAYWSDRPGLFDGGVYRSWERLRAAGPDFEHTLALEGYRYELIRGTDFYRFAREQLAAHANVTWLQGTIDAIEDGPNGARVRVDGRTYDGGWVFDSRFKPSELGRDSARYRRLHLHFKGWEIETPDAAFDPRVPTFFDFRTPQGNDVRFFYVLPLSEHRALVEYTIFSAGLLGRAAYELALHGYLRAALGVRHFRILREEQGVIPATNRAFARRLGAHVMAIGTRGGRVKPTTGYAFTRIQRDSAAIVDSLLRAGHPFDVPADSARYRLYDTLLLDIMARRPERIPGIFARMFARNPARRILRFLDEAGTLWEDVRLIATLPPAVFLETLARLALRFPQVLAERFARLGPSAHVRRPV